MHKTLGVQVPTQLGDLENIPTDRLRTTISEDWESLGRRNILSILLGTASDMTRMDLVEKGEGATEAKNKSRCLLAPGLLSDLLTLPLSPLISHPSLFVWSRPTSETRGTHTRTSRIPALRSPCSSASHLTRGHFPSYSGAVL